MTIFDFDISRGIYNFEFNELNSVIHAHPVVETINATNGVFSLESNGQLFDNLVFAIIDANTKHKVVSQGCTVSVLMIESHNGLLTDFFSCNGIVMTNGIFAKSYFQRRDELFSEFKELALANDLKTTTDDRIADSIRFIEDNEVEYKHLISSLISIVFLSESRLSHLFKQHIGVSIKKYLVWNKLKRAIDLYLTNSTSLTDVSIQSGFFDQAHLANSFKSVLGVSPSKAYNSRTLQASQKI